MIDTSLAPTTCVVRNTAARKGRTRAVAPGETALRFLHYGRIILDATDGPVTLTTGQLETGLIGLRGATTRQTISRSPHTIWRVMPSAIRSIGTPVQS